MGKLLTSLSSDLSDYRDNGDDKTYFLGFWRIKYDNTHNIHRATASSYLNEQGWLRIVLSTYLAK